jgi:DNA end-binding protein Ku
MFAMRFSARIAMASAATLPLSWNYREVLQMASRPVGNGNISFGLVSIPVRLFPATRSKSVSFNLLHAKDLSRIQQKIFCPVDNAIIDRSELVRGYEVAKDRYVAFSDEELKALEARGGDHSIEITEFVPLEQIDPIYFETSYYLGCEQASAKAYRLLTDAMTKTARVALGRYTLRGKEHVVVLRPYEKGLMMHTIYYADEVRSVEEIDRATNEAAKESELALAERLIGELTSKKIDLSKYHDTFREKVEEAAQQKIAGQQVTEAPEEPRRGQVIDLMAALKASLEKRSAGVAQTQRRNAENGAEPAAEAETATATGTGGAKAPARATRAGGGARRRAGGKK